MFQSRAQAATLILTLCAALPITVLGQPTASPEILEPSDMQWAEPLGDDSIKALWILGSEDKPENYLLRVQLEHGARIPPHTHPDARNTTVLEGSVLIGFGEHFDAENMIRIEAGQVYAAPAAVPHYLWAKDEKVVYQESGHGPSGMHLLHKDAP